MNILFIGDIVGEPGRKAIREILPHLRKEFDLDFVIANAENSAGGSGITSSVAKELFSLGIDVLTSGDHIWKRKEIFELIQKEKRILRPINFPEGAPGKGVGIFSTQDNIKVGVINVLGRVFMEALECPFRTTKKAVEEISKEADIIIVDIHAEATSEKIALGWFLDGYVSAIVGTHTHVQTADEKILPAGTAFITDVGMTGAFDSVIGRRKEDVLERFLSGLPVRFELANSDLRLQGVIIQIDSHNKTKSIFRIERKYEEFL